MNQLPVSSALQAASSLALIPLLILVAACAPTPPTVMGRSSVIDGDTLEVHGQRIRLWGVDAPESRQSCENETGATYACGRISARRLDQHLMDQTVSCFELDHDRYGRMVARCEINGEDVGAWLVKQGLAVRYARYAGTAYMIEEIAARRDRIGVWSGRFTNPEDWRRGRRGGK